jgi:hypothetical protein
MAGASGCEAAHVGGIVIAAIMLVANYITIDDRQVIGPVVPASAPCLARTGSRPAVPGQLHPHPR